MRRALAVLLAACAVAGVAAAVVAPTGIGVASSLGVASSTNSANGSGGDAATSGGFGSSATPSSSGGSSVTSGSSDGSGAPATERVLVVADADTGESVLVLPVEEGTTVTLAYTHSVEKTPVRDAYAVNGSQLEMVEMRFQSYGAGLPSRANVTEDGDWFVFDPPGSYRRVTVHPGSVAGHELVVGDDRYDLAELSGGESVELFVTHRCASEP